MFRLSRSVAPLLLLLVLVGSWPAEAAGGTGTGRLQPRDLAAQIWKAWAGLWADNGCSIDPDGRCAGWNAEEGCSVDPNGRRSCGPAGAATELVDEGCSVDPDGRCRSRK